MEEVDVVSEGCRFAFDGKRGGSSMFKVGESEVGDQRVKTKTQKEDLD